MMFNFIIKHKIISIIFVIVSVGTLSLIALFNSRFNDYYNKQKEVANEYIKAYEKDINGNADDQKFHEVNSKILSARNAQAQKMEADFGEFYLPWEKRMDLVKNSTKQMDASSNSFSKYVLIAGKLIEADNLFNQMDSDKNQLSSAIKSGTTSELTSKMQDNYFKLQEALTTVSSSLNKPNTQKPRLNSFQADEPQVEYYKYTLDSLKKINSAWLALSVYPTQKDIDSLVNQYNNIDSGKITQEADVVKQEAKKLYLTYRNVDNIKSLSQY